MNVIRIAAAAIALLIALSPQPQAQPVNHGVPFSNWLSAFKSEAAREGISPGTINAALSGLKPIPRVLELDRRQPEGTMTFARYRQNVVNQARIQKGRALLRDHGPALRRVSQTYGVPPQYIVALWGIETNFGANTGGFDLVPALATLAWEGRREAFFRKELLTALRILDEGHIDLARFKGSWAGAMGQNQFMPSSFMRFAVDGDGDGRKNIWTDTDDVFASTANYLSRSGWQENQLWGREVRLRPGFDPSLISLDIEKPLDEWSRLGVMLPNGHPLPFGTGMHASIVAPDGPAGPVFLAYDNYRVIMKWNRSTYFATSVGLLANAISG